MLSEARRQAVVEACETLLAPGRKWHLSPYVLASLDTAGLGHLAPLVPVYQSVVLDLLAAQQLPPRLQVLELGSPSGVGELALLDALLAWQTACAVFGVPPGVEHVTVCAEGKSGQAKALVEVFHQAVGARAKDLGHLNCLQTVATWSVGQAGRPAPPNFALVAEPWKRAAVLDRLLDSMPEGAIVAGLAWQSAGAADGNVHRWRYELLERRSGWIALGPCGQEYGRELPRACLTCFHGRREPVHVPSAKGAGEPIAWTYTMISRRAEPVESPQHDVISKEQLAQVLTEKMHVRYVGTFRQKVIPADHPDAVNDNPTDEAWQEYLKVCPGRSGADGVVIRRRAGMQTPRLRYGQWLGLRQVQPQRNAANSGAYYVLGLRDESGFFPVAGLPRGETFASDYGAETRAAVDEAAYRLFGFARMRSFQHTILERVLAGRDILAIAATGGGKSECYILPAMLLPGVTVVVSPLKSLILDQYEQRLRDRYGLDYLATFINGDVPFYERQGRLRRMVLGHFRLVYMTPEQLERTYVLDALREVNQAVGLRYLAMDEAHCISQWGHDFRPSYLNIVQRLEDYGLKPCRIAVTATASPLVRDDVCAELRLDARDLSSGGDVFVDSSDRPELNLVVRRVRTSEEKARIIVDALRKMGEQGSAIVFMPHTGGTPASPRDMGAPRSDPRPECVGMVSPGATPFAHYLERQLGSRVALYHGSLDDEALLKSVAYDGQDRADTDTRTRQGEQRCFMSDEKRIMVATKGFGMGIDKPDIRLVIHRSPPGDLEAYAQEAGRAGRDGKLATVMLLVSDDRPQIQSVSPGTYLARTSLPSDKEIQQYFIEQRYVRRQDVQAMLAFLRSGKPRVVNGAFYFTNDEVMAFFDSGVTWPPATGTTRYAWPNFPPRKGTGTYESPEHRHILDRGYEYNQKRQHIGRILAVLFNNRPSIGGRQQPLVRSVHEVGTILRAFRLYQPERIVDSPVYFGERFRRAGITASELCTLLPNGDFTDLQPLAERLGLSLRETASMLQDIRYCEGRTGQDEHWLGTMLNFWWIEVPRRVAITNAYTDLAAWRSYAGARRRTKPQGDGTTLDDYFPWSVVNTPSGWEVTPDVGLRYPDPAAYLDAFMTLHDERRRNDESNFAYLLERYAGDDSGPRQCLRALLLGYLKTNEVVVGNKCYGCSVCVPDLRFDQYPVAIRRQAVARLLPETIGLLASIEASNRALPPGDSLDRLLDAIALEEKTGRSGKAYLESWLARLMQDDPEHRGALWLRIHAVDRSLIEISPADLLDAVERLVRLSDVPDEMERLQGCIEQYRKVPRYRAQHVELTSQAAELAARRREWALEASAWGEVLAATDALRKGTRKGSLLQRALSRLIELHREDGPLPDKKRAAEMGLRLARLPGISLQDAKVGYGLAVGDWRWHQVQEELDGADVPQPAAAFWAWLETSPSIDRGAAVQWLERQHRLWSGWPAEVLQAIETHLARDLEKAPGLLLLIGETVMGLPGREAAAAQYLLSAWAAGADLTARHLRHVAAHLTKLNPEWCQKKTSASVRSSALLKDLLSAREGRPSPVDWLPYFPSQVIDQLPDTEIGALLEVAVHGGSTLSPDLLRIVAERINQPETTGLLTTVSRLSASRPNVAMQVMGRILDGGQPPPPVVVVLFPALLQERADSSAVGRILDRLCSVQEVVAGDGLVALCLDNWSALKADMMTWRTLRQGRIEGGTLVDLVTRWLSGTHKPHRLDLLVIILRDVRSRSSSSWLTPVSLELQVLCAAGRFKEAALLVSRYPDLSVRRKDAREYLREAQSRTAERQGVYEAEFKQLWVLARDLP